MRFHAPRAQRSAAGEIESLLLALGPSLRAFAEKKLAAGEVDKASGDMAISINWGFFLGVSLQQEPYYLGFTLGPLSFGSCDMQP